MPDFNDLFNLQQPHLTGRLITVPESINRITSITVPEAPGIMVLNARDLKTNSINIYDTPFPVFAEETDLYPNQPILAVFGQEPDTLELFCRNVKVEGTFSEPEAPEEICSRTFVSGSLTPDPTRQLREITTEYRIRRYDRTLLHMHRIFAVMNDGLLHLSLSSQWATHLKKCVSTALDLDWNRIVFHDQGLQAREDQLLFLPSMYAVIAACAAVKSEKMIELDVPLRSVHPALTFNTKTLLTEEGVPVSQTSTVTADTGAVPYCTEEYIRNLIAGCTPVCKLEKLEVTVRVMKSGGEPGLFFGDLGYSDALAATERHYSQVAKFSEQIPSEFRALHSGAEYPQIRTSDTKQVMKDLIERAAETSRFSRNYFAFTQQGLFNSSVASLLSYSRGIGIACGEGVQGFSNINEMLNTFVTHVKYTEDGKLYIDNNLATKKTIRTAVEEIAMKELKIKREQIVFADLDTGNEDLGPYTLSRAICFLPGSVQKACREIKEELEKGKTLPLDIVSQEITTKKSLFNSHTCGCTIAEAFMDPALIALHITKIRIFLHTGTIFNEFSFQDSVRKEAIAAINANFPCLAGTPDFEIDCTTDPELENGSVSSLVKGMVIAACGDAVEQAMNSRTEVLPLTAQDIMQRYTEKPDENQLHN